MFTEIVVIVQKKLKYTKDNFWKFFWSIKSETSYYLHLLSFLNKLSYIFARCFSYFPLGPSSIDSIWISNLSSLSSIIYKPCIPDIFVKDWFIV